jgi:hypothetical protein
MLNNGLLRPLLFHPIRQGHRRSCHPVTLLPNSSNRRSSKNFFVAVFGLLYLPTGGSSRMGEIFVLIGLCLIVGALLLDRKSRG